VPKPFRVRRRGAIIVLTAIILVVMVILIALAVDIGYLSTVRTELQCAADAGALAGAAEMTASRGKAIAAARDFVQRNVDVETSDINVQMGRWDRDSRNFVPGQNPADALLVTVRQPETPLFFGRIVGRSSQSLDAQAIAACSPRDIMLVLDYSGSMNSHKRIDELKKAVALFVAILQATQAPDRVGFARYSTDGELVLPLTSDLAAIEEEVRSRNAAGWTNIGHGMELARLELEESARPIATKMVVIMTDGKVNRPLGREPRSYVIDEAELAAAAGFVAVTISFGDDADKKLMQEVADITKGVHFNVPDSVSANEDDLREVFRKIALNRTVKLVE
jgi:Mg-chelatase subunit ChlD